MSVSKLSSLLKEHFSRELYPAGFNSNIIKQAGRKIKKEGKEITRLFLEENYDPEYVKRDFDLVARANILWTSSPIEAWGIVKVKQLIEQKYYGLRENDPLLKIEPNKENHLNWFKATGLIENSLDELPYAYTAGLNLIFQNVKKIREGLYVKAKNKYLKDCEKAKRMGDDLPSESKITNEEGFLLNLPGHSPTIYGYQGCDLRPIDSSKDKDLLIKAGYENYNRQPSDEINSYYKISERLEIPRNEPGFIAHKNKVNLYIKDTFLYKSKRRKIKNNKPEPILYVAKFGNEYCIFDGRGFLRQVRRLLKEQKLIFKEPLTIQNLLKCFKNDPVIYPTKEKEQLSLSFKEGNVKVPTQNVFSFKNKEKLNKEIVDCRKHKNVVILGVDLGQTNVLGYQTYLLPKLEIGHDNEQISQHLSKYFIRTGKLTTKNISDLESCRSKLDDLEQKLNEIAAEKLSFKDQEEYARWKKSNAETTKQKIIDHYQLPSMKWNEMNNFSTQIASFLAELNNEDAFILINDQRKLKRDIQFKKQFSEKLSPDIRKILTDEKWKLQKINKEYQKIAIRKKELIRSIVNNLISELEKEFDAEVLICVEKLNRTSKLFSGKGKQEIGWNYFFESKKENRFFINDFIRTIVDLPQNKGKIVCQVNPAYTSQTCPKCNFADRNNRTGEHFKCLKCNYCGNTDIDVAPFNIIKVALSGNSLPKPENAGCERSGAVKKARRARNPKPVEITSKKEIDISKISWKPYTDTDRSQTES